MIIITKYLNRIRWYECFLLFILIISYIIDVVGDCDMFNDCNGHGVCKSLREIAVDFDGTLCVHKFPNIGGKYHKDNLYEKIHTYIRKQKE
jgi:hypothetical protein